MSRISRSYSNERPLARASRDLERLKRKLQDLNSQFPATKRFLAMKGVENVDQLDRQDMQELREYLQGLYRGMLH